MQQPAPFVGREREQQYLRAACAGTDTGHGALILLEQEVALLLAAGRSNIAESLVISEGTVEVHVRQILSKLALQSRSRVAAWLADQRV